jgi:hypothetical protein
MHHAPVAVELGHDDEHVTSSHDAFENRAAPTPHVTLVHLESVPGSLRDLLEEGLRPI